MHDTNANFKKGNIGNLRLRFLRGSSVKSKVPQNRLPGGPNHIDDSIPRLAKGELLPSWIGIMRVAHFSSLDTAGL